MLWHDASIRHGKDSIGGRIMPHSATKMCQRWSGGQRSDHIDMKFKSMGRIYLYRDRAFSEWSQVDSVKRVVV